MRNPKLCKAIEYLIDRWGPLSRSRLPKLVYLADQDWALRHGMPYTEANYIRGSEGPFAAEILEALEKMNHFEIIERDDPAELRFRAIRYFSGVVTRLKDIALDSEFAVLLDKIGQEWHSRPVPDLLDHIYADESFDRIEIGADLFSKVAG